jgi:hypothetical protein
MTGAAAEVLCELIEFPFVCLDPAAPNKKRHLNRGGVH